MCLHLFFTNKKLESKLPTHAEKITVLRISSCILVFTENNFKVQAGF